MKENISGIEEIDTCVKESKQILAQNMQKTWNTMKRPNLGLIGIELRGRNPGRRHLKHYQQNHRRKKYLT